MTMHLKVAISAIRLEHRLPSGDLHGPRVSLRSHVHRH